LRLGNCQSCGPMSNGKNMSAAEYSPLQNRYGKGFAATHKPIVTGLPLRLHSPVEEYPYNQTGLGD
jgi:hypothetical protein